MELLIRALREYLDGNLEMYLRSLSTRDMKDLANQCIVAGDMIQLVDRFRVDHTTIIFLANLRPSPN